MDNYGEILEKEKKLTKKRDLVEDTIVADKLTKHEIISKMYHGLVNEIEELKVILFADLSVTNNSKEKAEKISKIAFALQTCLDMEKGEKNEENKFRCIGQNILKIFKAPFRVSKKIC